MDEYDEMCWQHEAVDHVLTAREEFLEDRATSTVPVAEIAGQRLAEPIVAETAQPTIDRATMDGYAFADDDDGPLEIVENAVFPETKPPALEAGQAIEIATGHRFPDRADTVVKREDAVVDGGRLQTPDLATGTYVYERGSNVEAGEQLYTAGDRLTALDAVLLRDLGRESVVVTAPLSVAVLATGTEIHEGRHTDLDSPMLCNLVRSWALPSYRGSVPDEGDRVERRIAELASEADVVVTTGGTSVGKKDYVIDALESPATSSSTGSGSDRGSRSPSLGCDHDALAVAIPGNRSERT